MRYRIVNPDGPVRAECAATYLADNLLPVAAYAFVFRVLDSDTRFTVYASDQHRYLINDIYTLTLGEPEYASLRLSADETAFLRHCLGLVEQRWHEAIAEADAGAERPATEKPAEPGHVNVEPTPTGYRAIAGRFRDELDRVQQLRSRLDQLLSADQPDQDGDPS
jgi:hypothetical protein